MLTAKAGGDIEFLKPLDNSVEVIILTCPHAEARFPGAAEGSLMTPLKRAEFL